MQELLYLSATIASLILNFVGIIMSLFITVVSCKTWVKSHRISSSDRILFSLGITRFLLLGLLLLNTIYVMSSNTGRSVYLSAFFMLCWMFLDSTSVWFVTLLNSLYCVKITNFQHSVFFLLKRTISPKTPRLLLASVLISAFTTFLYIILSQTSPVPQLVTKRNDTSFNVNDDILSLVVSLFLSSFPQFIINVTSASLLIYSLRRHTQKMQRNATGFWNPQMEAHVGAMKLMIYFLILYIPYSVATVLHYLPFYVGMSMGAKFICMVFATLYSPGHSVLIIITHPKLKTTAKKIFCFKK
ncbi:taste receptor type 2 member 4 [Saimiri boliviensis]|uniref:taste receptor type 2 member 4 n=1 Tax=Saimiri boliviensis TaxID=27679 RepID=UPI00027F92BA|nr:taste receptor type 2 member 4 [Saimiri boliviensis boliviensis]